MTTPFPSAVSIVRRSLPALLLSLATGAASCDAPPRAPTPARHVIDSLFSRFSAPGMPGASVVVIRNGDVVLGAAYGLSDVEGAAPATTATHYRLASLTKQFTAMAILLLVKDGVLTLDTPARTILPELPAYASGVTLRNLLTHTSGLWDYEDFVPDTQSYQVKDRDALSLVAARAESLYFAPGSKWRYSNTGYALLALMVERVSRTSFPDFLRERIFAPLGMRSTVAHEDGKDTVAHRAWGYTLRGDSVVRTDQSSTSAVLGDGGIYSSVDELVKWDAALTSGALVGDSLWREATTPAVLTSGAATTYGFGWFVDAYQGRARLHHHGESRGFTNAISRYPDEGLTIIVLTNRTGSAPWDLVDRLSDLYFGPLPTK
jgi:CubicO group peptidase (beta-lactamase class C family)